MNTNTLDFGLVIGINSYAGLTNLKGAVQDAAAFTSWLCDPSGGALPQENVRTLIGERDPQRPHDPYYPTLEQIDQALFEFVQMCGDQQGRRLYFYFAGHGIGTAPTDVAMLLASARPGYLNNNLSLQVCCNQLHNSACFSELIFFLDCCREFNDYILTRGLALSLPRDEQRAQFVRRLVIYATGYGALAFEPSSLNYDGRGLLTQALLEGLTGSAAKQGKVTADGLYRYVQRRVGELANDHSLDQQPHVEMSQPDFLVCRVGRRRRWTKPPQPPIAPQVSATQVPSVEPAWEGLVMALLRLTRKFDDPSKGALQEVTLLENLFEQDGIATLAAEAGLSLTEAKRQVQELQRGIVPELRRSATDQYIPLIIGLIDRAGKSAASASASPRSVEHIALARDSVLNALATVRLLGERSIRWKLEGALRRAALVLDACDDALLVLDKTGRVITEHVPARSLAGSVQEWKQTHSSTLDSFGSVPPVKFPQPSLFSVRTLLVYLQPAHLFVRLVSFHQANNVIWLDLVNELRLVAEQAAQHAVVAIGSEGHISTLLNMCNSLVALCDLIEQKDTGAAQPESYLATKPLSVGVIASSGQLMRSQYDRLDRWLSIIALDDDFRALIRILLPTVPERNRMPQSAETITRAKFLAHMDDLGRLDDLEDLLMARFPNKRPE